MYLTDFQKDRSDSAKTGKVGLYFSNTGTPVFVLATSHTVPLAPFEIQDPAQIVERLPETSHLIDKLVHVSVKSFFAAGGEKLMVLPVSIDIAAEDLNEEFSSKLIGADAGYVNRTGFHALKNFDALADLLVFPQAAAILSAHELSRFYQSVLGFLETYGRFFLLMDTPCYSSPEKVLEWAREINGESGAIFFPWVSIQDQSFVASSSIIAALIQGYDKKFGIHQCIANREVPSNLKILSELSVEQVRTLTDARVNTLRTLPQQKLTLWGCYTCARDHQDQPLIHVVRTMKSVQDAVERVCESFSLEPKTSLTCDRIKESVDFFLEDLSKKGFFAKSAQSKGYRTNCSIAETRPKEEGSIDLEVELALERPDEYLGLKLKY